MCTSAWETLVESGEEIVPLNLRFCSGRPSRPKKLYAKKWITYRTESVILQSLAEGRPPDLVSRAENGNVYNNLIMRASVA
jgi:hypothetical protein